MVVVGRNVNARLPGVLPGKVLLVVGKDKLTQWKTLGEFRVNPIGIHFAKVFVLCPFAIQLEIVVF